MNPKPKILIVEDDKDTQLAMSMRVKSLGYAPTLASDAVIAMQKVVREKPDVILLDLGLPGGDGITVLEKVKTLDSTAHIPVIVTTARDAEYWREKAMGLGAGAYLAKPIDAKLLELEIKRALGETPIK